MIGFDLLLGSTSLIAPRSTLRFFGHEEPSPEVIAGLRRLSGMWLTSAAAHPNAERGGEAQEWGAPGGLGGSEFPAAPIWSPPPGGRRPATRPPLCFPGPANTAMTAG